MANIKELAKQPERLSGGHRLCAGCGASIVVRFNPFRYIICSAASRISILFARFGIFQIHIYIQNYSILDNIQNMMSRIFF